MSIGNHNNELNALFHRNAVRETIHAYKTVCDEMDATLDLNYWDEITETFYSKLCIKRESIIQKLKIQGAFL